MNDDKVVLEFPRLLATHATEYLRKRAYRWSPWSLVPSWLRPSCAYRQQFSLTAETRLRLPIAEASGAGSPVVRVELQAYLAKHVCAALERAVIESRRQPRLSSVEGDAREVS